MDLEIPEGASENLPPSTDPTGHQRGPRGASSSSLLPTLLLVIAASFYLIATYKIATSKEPFVDEGWIASPGYNLAFHGFMGTSVLDPHGSWLHGELKGIRQYTYWIMPLDILAQAAWYRLFGFGIVQVRLLAATFGARPCSLGSSSSNASCKTHSPPVSPCCSPRLTLHFFGPPLTAAWT